MVVLAAIGAFFKKIWDWIRNTAWVQPLLIVGIIFGVIFSIPAIVNAIKDAQEESEATENYYHQYQLSLEGGKDSQADKVTELIFKAVESPTEDNVKAVKEEVGSDKFFFVFVEDECAKCADAKYGFDYLQKNWTSYGQSDEFKMISVFADEYTSEDTASATGFRQYLDRNSAFFEVAGEAAYATDFYELKGITDDDIANIELANVDLTPTILLIDFTSSSPQVGISEVTVGTQGETDKAKADFFLHCWNHTDEFSINHKTL